MFGLMKDQRSCNQQESFQRYHYCATCKSIGKAYGQKSRVFLNYDAVFLAEILSSLLKKDIKEWETSLQAVNQCWTMPKTEEDLPQNLKYAAAANIFFAQLKFRDDIADEEGGKKWLHRFYENKLDKAASDLQSYGLDLSNCYEWADLQLKRESEEVDRSMSFEHYLNYCAEATAEISAAVFSNAAVFVGLDQAQQDFYQLGYALGQLMYVLDALEDFSSDLKKQKFNPFLQYYSVGQASSLIHSSGWDLVDEYRMGVEQELLQLSIDELEKERYAARLLSNILERQAKWEAPEAAVLSFKEAWKKRWVEAQAITTDLYCKPQNLQQKVQYNLMFFAVVLSPSSIWKSSSNLHLVLTAILATLGIGYFMKFLPIDPNKKKKKGKKRRKNPCEDQCRRECGKPECKLAMFIILLLALLLIAGILWAMIGGIILLTQGVVFWGLFWLLLFPVLIGLCVLIYYIAYN